MSLYVATIFSVKGTGFIDFVLSFSKVKAKLMSPYIDYEVEIFTGAPKRGHVPVLNALTYNHTRKEDITETRHF